MTATSLAGRVNAQVIYDNGSINNNSFGFSSDIDGGNTIADTSTLATSASFNSVEWYGGYTNSSTPVGQVYTPAAVDNFTISFYNTTPGTINLETYAGIPNANPIPGLVFNVGNNVNRTVSSFTVSSAPPQPIYRYSSVLPSSVSLGSGIYGIGIVNNTTGDTARWFWSANTSNDQNDDFFVRVTGNSGPYTSTFNGNLVFRLSNVAAAPEPGSIAFLLAAGVPALGLVHHRKKSI